MASALTFFSGKSLWWKWWKYFSFKLSSVKKNSGKKKKKIPENFSTHLYLMEMPSTFSTFSTVSKKNGVSTDFFES